MREITKKIFLLILVITIALFFVPASSPSPLQIEALSENDFIIIFSSGGWGDATLEEATDFSPIVKGIKDSLNEWGYNSIIVPYCRSKEGVLNKLPAVKDFFLGYSFSSKKLAEELDSIINIFPDKRIILAGLSNGAAFINESYSKISKEAKDSVYAISLGIPFWAEKNQDENILQIDNNGKDALSNGRITSLLASIVKAPFLWISSFFAKEKVSLAGAFKASEHEYLWSSPIVKDRIVLFLEEKVR